MHSKYLLHFHKQKVHPVELIWKNKTCTLDFTFNIIIEIFLKNNSSDYSSDLNFIRQLGLDEILVRCCGFHKISSVCDKTITTSCISYEEELSEYIERGWNIDFVKPIVLNPSTKRLEEYSDEFLLIKKMYRNK